MLVGPERADRILHLVRETRGGALNDAAFDRRFRGEGPYAEAIGAAFRLQAARLGYGVAAPGGGAPPATFRRPGSGRQLGLFGGG